MNKLKKIWWFIKHPKLYPQLIYMLFRNVVAGKSPLNDTRDQATLWCAEQAINTKQALEKITGVSPVEDVEDKYEEVFNKAHLDAEACKIKMGGPGDLDLIYWLAEYSKAKRVIETGVAYGWSSLALLLSLKNREGSKLISTDMPYPHLNNEQYVGCVVPTELKSNWHLLQNADRQALPKALKELGTIDLCHYDSDKTYEGRMWAYEALWKALRPGGIFISDDISDNVAFQNYAHEVQVEPVVIERDGKYIGVLVRPDN